MSVSQKEYIDATYTKILKLLTVDTIMKEQKQMCTIFIYLIRIHFMLDDTIGPVVI